MKNSIFMIVVLITISTMVTAQTSSFSVGYNKNFPLAFRNNHIVWSQFKRTYPNRLFVSFRTDFHTWESVLHGSGNPNIDYVLGIFHDNDFVPSYEIDTDNVNDGIVLVSTADGLDIDIYGHLLVGYVIDLNKWKLHIGGGPGVTYYKHQDIRSADIVELTDERFEGEIAFLPYINYKRGLLLSVAASVNVEYALTENFSIGVDIFGNNQANNLITHGLNANLKF